MQNSHQTICSSKITGRLTVINIVQVNQCSALKIADVFEVTLDFLVDDTAVASFDKQTVKRLKDIEHLSEDDRKTLFSMMDAFLRDAKARKAYAS